MLDVLIVINHAPDYRERFFIELSKLCRLTVVAQPCQSGGLVSPEIRGNYEYIELPARRIGPFLWQSEIEEVLSSKRFDVYCIDFNPRMLSTLFCFYRFKEIRDSWIWRGSIFGSSELKILDKFRNILFNKANSTLVYNEEIASRIQEKYGVMSRSFNNTEVDIDDVVPPKANFSCNLDRLHVLFVGRYQPRKKIERLIELARSNPLIELRLIGPGMDTLKPMLAKEELTLTNVKIYGRSVGNELKEHFAWGHVVFNPGHAGLLVLNAARHGLPIVIDKDSRHAPEYYMAVESKQLFISFSDIDEVNRTVAQFLENPALLTEFATRHQNLALQKYTFQYMAEAHMASFLDVVNNGAQQR